MKTFKQYIAENESLDEAVDIKNFQQQLEQLNILTRELNSKSGGVSRLIAGMNVTVSKLSREERNDISSDLALYKKVKRSLSTVGKMYMNLGKD